MVRVLAGLRAWKELRGACIMETEEKAMKKIMTLFLSLFVTAAFFTASPFRCYAEDAAGETVMDSQSGESESEEVSGSQDESDTSATQQLSLVESLEGVALPEGATEITYTYHGSVIAAAKTEDELYLLPVQAEDGGVVWYVYDEATDQAIPYTRFSNLEEVFVIIPLEDGVEVPKEFESVMISLDGKNLPAWRNPKSSDVNMYFVYVMNSQGEKAFYRFDGDAGLLLRYVPDVIEPETTETEPQTDNPELISRIAYLESQESIAVSNYKALNEEHEESMMIRALIIIGLAALAMILLLVVAVLASKLGKRKRELEEAEEERDRAQARNLAGGARARQRERAGRDDYADPRRPEREEEGTSAVRPVRRPARGSEERIGKTTTTSEVKPAYRDRQEQDRPVSPRRSSYRRPEPEEDYAQEPVRRRRPAEQDDDALFDRRRSAQPTRPARRTPQETRERQERQIQQEDEPVRRRPAQQAPVRRPAARKTQEERQEDVTLDLTEEKRPAEAPENMTESVKVATGNSSKPVVEDLFEEEQDADDFDVTDFKNV